MTYDFVPQLTEEMMRDWLVGAPPGLAGLIRAALAAGPGSSAWEAAELAIAESWYEPAH